MASHDACVALRLHHSAINAGQMNRNPAPIIFPHQGAVEKSRQRRSHQFSVLTYWKYAPRAKPAAALLNELF